jgi:hypothetical protein
MHGETLEMYKIYRSPTRNSSTFFPASNISQLQYAQNVSPTDSCNILSICSHNLCYAPRLSAFWSCTMHLHRRVFLGNQQRSLALHLRLLSQFRLQ